MLEAKDVRVKGRQCIVIDPTNQDLRLKLHWLLHNVTEEDVRVALSPYGRFTDVTRERWRVQGIHDKGSTTRAVTLKLKAGVRAEDLPHQLRVAGESALVVVPGRAPQCLRCQSTGHMRRECKVPRCSVCRRFGHEAAQCTRTYAAVTGPVPDDSSADLVMDAEEAEELAAGSEPPRQPTQEARAEVPGSSAPPPRDEEIVREEETTSPVAATVSAASVAPDATLSQQTPTRATEDAGDAASKSDANEVRGEDGSVTKRPRHERDNQAAKEDTATDGDACQLATSPLLLQVRRLAEVYLSLLALACVTHTAGARKHKTRPHIVFILADDLGWADVGFHGSSQIPTPNLDALAFTGVVLNNYYVQELCSPSRGALMSGLYPIHLGMQQGAMLPGEPSGLPLDVKIMPERLKELGYETHMLGKWHLGYYSLDYTPTHRGFDSFCGLHLGPDDYYSHELKWGGNVGLDFWNNTEPLTTENGTYSTTLFSKRATDIIANRDDSKPLFLYMAHQAPHAGIRPELLQAPAENVNKFSYIGDGNRTIYAGMVDAMDQSVGDIVEALEAASMLEDTIIVFSSDNGALPEGPASNHGYNWPFRGGKETLWEGGVRGAAFLWGPRLLPRRRVSQQLMHVTDWLPTLYSAAGGDTKQLGPLDGFDMWQALTVGKPSPRTEILHNIDNQAGVAALRHGQYKLLIGSYGTLDARFEIPGASLPYGDLDPLMRQSRTAAVLKRLYGKKQVFNNAADWRRQATVACRDVVNANFASGSSYYLFNVAHDPCEQINLADERPALLSMLLERLQSYNETVLPPVNATQDSRSYPKYHNGIWAPWV
ncbi:arylsulfatase B-like [Haemaphysalis longicornis]